MGGGGKFRILDFGLRIEQPMLDTGFWILDKENAGKYKSGIA
jgi:hypothetical protein